MTRTLPIMLVLLGTLSAAMNSSSQAFAQGDVFSGNGSPTASGKAPASTDAAACGDPQIAQIEQESGTTARVFDFRASGTKSGYLGGILQDRGLIQHTGVCVGKPNALVMFIANNNIAGVDKVTNEYFAASETATTPLEPNNNSHIRLHGGVTKQVPTNPGNAPVGTTGQGDASGQGGAPHKVGITKGYPAPPGFKQPQPPNYVCFDEDGYPYTYMEDPGVEGNYTGPEYTGVGEHAPRIPPERIGYDECINPHVPKGCPQREYNGKYKPIRQGAPCYPPLAERGAKKPHQSPPSKAAALDSKPEASVCKTDSRFDLGNINDADPALLITAKVTEGYDNCLKENFVGDLVGVPLNLATRRFRLVRNVAAACSIIGDTGSSARFIADINALREHGQSLADVSKRIGRLICEGKDIKDIIARRVPMNASVKKKPPPEIAEAEWHAKTNYPKPPSALERGIPLNDDRVIQGIAMQEGKIIIVRDSNPLAMKWIGHPNAVPKPLALKMKTLKTGPHSGLASAKNATPEQILEIQAAGFKIDPKTGLITTPEGKWLYSDLDVHGVYDTAGRDAWTGDLAGKWSSKLVEHMFQHGPHDNWPDRNDIAKAGANYGPKPPVTVYLPDGTKQWLQSVGEMRDFYHANGLPWNQIYPLH